MTTLPLTTEYALLGFLRQRPMHGYEIHQQLSAPNGLGLVWHLKQSRLYALLAKLEQGGFVTTAMEPQENRPARKVFSLTSQGQAAYLAWMQNPVERGRRLRLDFLAKLYFSLQEGPENARSLINRQTAVCRSWLIEQQSQLDVPADEEPFDRLVHEFRLSQTRAMLNWLNTCHTTLFNPPKESAHES
jgi:DNA-binding PadR family transcriptional regulator